MNHEELLDKIEDVEYWQEQYASKTFLKALRAVVEMHYPHEITWAVKQPFVACYSCGEEYPCPTIEAIEEELG